MFTNPIEFSRQQQTLIQGGNTHLSRILIIQHENKNVPQILIIQHGNKNVPR